MNSSVNATAKNSTYFHLIRLLAQEEYTYWDKGKERKEKKNRINLN